MTVILDPASPDLRRFIHPGDRILCAEGPGEPQILIEALVDQRASLGGVEVFVGLGLGSTLRPDSVDGLGMRSYGALGTTRRLADAGLLDIVPVALGDIPAMLTRGDMAFDVVLTSVAPADDDSHHSLGLMALHVPAAIRHARTVIAEVNTRMPRTFGVSVPASRLAAIVHSDRPRLLSPPSTSDPVVEAIAAHVATVVPDGATLQLGVGAIPDAVCRHLVHHRDLGIHSGMLNDGLIDLMRRGVVNNRLKADARGVSVVGAILGSEDAYRFVHRNPEVRLEGVEITHGMAHHEPALVAINSALEVDVLGQVNAEVAGGRYIGAIGGQPQFTRAGGRSPRGAGIIALPSTVVSASGERISRIRGTPVERVTTASSDVDVIVTEHGVARLAGRSAAERRQALVAIAHPQFQDAL